MVILGEFPKKIKCIVWIGNIMTPGEGFLGQGGRESNFMDFCWDVWNQVFYVWAGLGDGGEFQD